MNYTTKKHKPNINKAGILIFKMAAASGLSWELAKLAGSKHPYLAPLSVILCLQSTVQKSVQYSYQRIIGTIVGVCVTALVAGYLPLNGWTLTLLLLIGTAIMSLMKTNESVLHQTALSVLFVFALTQQSGQYPIDRIRDTMVGVLVAILIHTLVFPPNFTKEAKKPLIQLTGELSDRLITAAVWVRSGCPKGGGQRLNHEVQSFHKSLFQADKEMEKAFKSLKYNPFAKNSCHLLTMYREHLQQVKHGIEFLGKTLKTMELWSSSGYMSPDDRTLWSNQLRIIALYWSDRKEILQRKETEFSAAVPGSQLYADPISLQAKLPMGMEPHQYPVSLYTDTVELLQELHH